MPPKTLKNQRFSDVFIGVSKEASGIKWVELLMLVTRLASFSFMVTNFVTYKKVLIMILHIERSFLTFLKMCPESSKTAVKEFIF